MASNPTNPLLDMFQKFGTDLQLPGPQVSDIVDFHRKNLQTLQEVAMATSDGAQKMMAMQRETLEAALADITVMVESARSSGSPMEMATGSSEIARKSFEATIANTSALAEIARETGATSFEALKLRVEESLRELQEGVVPKG